MTSCSAKATDSNVVPHICQGRQAQACCCTKLAVQALANGPPSAEPSFANDSFMDTARSAMDTFRSEQSTYRSGQETQRSDLEPAEAAPAQVSILSTSQRMLHALMALRITTKCLRAPSSI